MSELNLALEGESHCSWPTDAWAESGLLSLFLIITFHKLQILQFDDYSLRDVYTYFLLASATRLVLVFALDSANLRDSDSTR